jgi:hypothetical protein
MTPSSAARMQSSLRISADRFVAWLTKTRDAFGFRGADPRRQLTLLKPFSEFILCNDLLLSYDAPKEAMQNNLHWAWSELEEGEHLVRLLLARPDLFRLAAVYAPLHRNGFSNARLEGALMQVSRLRGTSAVGTQPWMHLCFHHAMAEITGACYDPCAVPGSWLLAKPEPWCINDEIAYSVTHEVFYASDFGRSPCTLPADVCRYLQLWLPVWTSPYYESANWDLTADMIMVADCLGGGIWDVDPLPTLLANQRPDGMVPGPPGAGSSLVAGTDIPEEIAFFSSYHTTLVSAMASWLRLYRTTSMHADGDDRAD